VSYPMKSYIQFGDQDLCVKSPHRPMNGNVNLETKKETTDYARTFTQSSPLMIQSDIGEKNHVSLYSMKISSLQYNTPMKINNIMNTIFFLNSFF